MKGKGLGTCAGHLAAEMGTIKSMDVVSPVRVGETRVEMRLRTVSKPDRMTAKLLARLGLQLPARSKIIENVVQKNGSKCAQTVENQRTRLRNCGRWPMSERMSRAPFLAGVSTPKRCGEVWGRPSRL